MPFGLMNAPATFQRMASEIFANMPYVEVYIEYVIESSKTVNEHVEHIRHVCDRIRRMGLKLRIGKCVFAFNETPILGHVISSEGVKADRDELDRVRNTRQLQNKKYIWSFLMFSLF